MRTPQQAAEHMLNAYGSDKAHDYANVYWVSAKYDKRPLAEKYWKEVCDLIEAVPRRKRREQ